LLKGIAGGGGGGRPAERWFRPVLPMDVEEELTNEVGVWGRGRRAWVLRLR
jgi:hypothetical protein